MTKIKTQLVYLSKRDAALTPGRLDTSVTIEDSESGAATDTLLAPASANTMSVGLASMPEEDWRIVADQSPDPDERALAKRRINEIQLIRLAVGQVNGEQDNSELIAQVELELYGHYTERLYYDALFQKIAQIESLNLPLKIPGLQEARAELLDRLYEILPNDYSETAERHNPSQKTIQAIKEWIDGQFEDVFEFVDHFTNDELGAEDIKKVFDMCIDTTPVLRQMGWSCQIVDREKGAISVYAADKIIIIPRMRKATKDVIKRLVVHEIFGHALRSANAEKDDSTVGRIGSGTYQSFEESFEIVLEQCFAGKYDPMRGVDHYVAIGLSKTSGKTKAEISHIFNSCAQLIEYANQQSHIGMKGVENSANEAKIRIRRTFAGMTDVDEGIPHMKDIDYYHGIRQSWELLETLVELDILEEGLGWLLSAKFNPYDKQDREMVEKFHPMPSQLYEYFNNVST